MAISLLHNWAVLQHAPSAKLITLCRVSKLSQGAHSTKVFDISPRAHCCAVLHAPIVIADQLGTETEREGEKERERNRTECSKYIKSGPTQSKGNKGENNLPTRWAAPKKKVWTGDELQPTRAADTDTDADLAGRRRVEVRSQCVDRC